MGHKALRELGDRFKALRNRLPQVEVLPPRIEPIGDAESGVGSLEPTTVEAMARQAATLRRAGSRKAEQEIVHRYLGWVRDENRPLAAGPG